MTPNNFRVKNGLIVGNNANITGYVNASSYVNATSFNVGATVVANTTGVFATHLNGASASGYALLTGALFTGIVNAATVSVGTSFIANTTRVVVGTSTGLQANGGIGSAGQVLHSNGTTVYWAADDGITSIVAANGLSGGTITSTGQLDVVGGAGLISNSTGVHVGSANGISVSADAVGVTTGSTLTVNATGIHVNAGSLSIATSQLTGDVALGTNTSGNYVATITAGAGISGSSSAEGGTPTIAVVAGSGIASNATGVHVVAGNGTIVSNATGVYVNAAALSVATSQLTGDVALGANTSGNYVATITNANGISGSSSAEGGTPTIGVVTGSTLTVNTTGIHVNSALSIASLALSGDITVSGNLTVSGTRTYVNTTTLDVGDNIITLNADLGASAPSQDAGIEIMRGTSSNVQFMWDETNDRWSTNGQPLAVSSLIAAGAASGITTLAAGNTTITGFANVTSSLQVGGVATFAANANFDSGVLFVDGTNNRVGVNTTTPGVALDVTGSARVSESVTIGTGGTYAAGTIYSNADWGMIFRAKQASPTTAEFLWTNAADTYRMRIDGAGNLGVGVTPSAWNSDYKAFQIGAVASIAGRVGGSNTLDVTSNGFRGADGSWKYIASQPSARFAVDGSVPGFQWYIAATGTAGANISYTQAMTLNSLGQVGIGNTSPAHLLSVQGTAALGNTTITGFANVTSTIQGGSSLTIAGALSGVTTAAMGNTTITGFANVSVSVNSALFTVGTTVVANTTGTYATHLNAKTEGNLNVNTSTFSNTIIVPDTRNGNTTPETTSSPQVRFDFKANATDNLSDGGTYFGEMSFRPYGSTTDWTGGPAHQLGFTANNNIYHRSGTSTTWGAWGRLYKEGTLLTPAANVVMANNNITRPVLTGYTEHEISNTATTGTYTMDCGAANFFDLTLTGNITISPSNVPPATRVWSGSIAAKQDATGGRTITWPTGTKYAGGVAPPATTTANALDIWSLMTYDGGTSWIVSLSVKGVA